MKKQERKQKISDLKNSVNVLKIALRNMEDIEKPTEKDKSDIYLFKERLKLEERELFLCQEESLTKQESEVYNLLIIGVKNKEISDVLNINQKTVSTYKLRILGRFESKTIIEVINKKIALL